MSIVKSFAKAVYNFAFSEAERVAEIKPLLSDADRCAIATGYLARDAKVLDRNSLEYRKLLQLSEDLVVLHSGKSSFNQMARSHVRANSGSNYYITAALGRILDQHFPFNEQTAVGGESVSLTHLIGEEVKAAKEERNPIKRRSIIRKAIKAQVTTLEGTELDFAVEAVLLISA